MSEQKHITKLIAVELTEDEDRTYTTKKGEKYIYLQDPETGKYYEPNDGWIVTGDRLEELFHEVYGE